MTTVPARSTLSSQLADGVMSIVAERGLVVGDQLDGVKQLALRFNVAVPTMREALRRLEGIGIVELRHGSGVYVGPNAGRRVLVNPVLPRSDLEQLVELLRARRALEPEMARLAAEVRDERGLAWLDDVLEVARGQVAAQDGQLWRTNLDIHRAIAATTGNAILAEVLDSVVLVHAEDQRAILALHGDAAEDFEEHTHIRALIVAGDSAGAHAAVAEHLDSVIDVIRSRGETP
ncbi:FadR/GntR family transcriptional regulator [Pseudactinotalea terrae]|uniref:FadR/GntR family transcriptional regulator n=1 Tax=Pseudactinotalea terrae TaxID=1743262 RepID=UPI0012E188FA|nr:FCD domain-containing protein [Pseudactinotalea terrae]